jgi:hypothetical protein
MFNFKNFVAHWEEGGQKMCWDFCFSCNSVQFLFQQIILVTITLSVRIRCCRNPMYLSLSTYTFSQNFCFLEYANG